MDKAVRGTISNRLKAAMKSDPAKLDAEIQKANLQRVDVAALNFDSDTLKLSFTLRVLGNLDCPSACNDPEYEAALADLIKLYSQNEGFRELALRYATNIANGRFLWRNRIGAEALEVRVKHIEDNEIKEEWIFNCEEFGLRKFDKAQGDFAKLTEVVRQGLIGEKFAFLRIDAFALLGEGQEIFPSQELVLDKGQGDSQKSKILYQVDGVAALHSQKVGNALRTIDTWYPDGNEVGPIAVEPYGSVTNRGKAYRQPKDNMDFYSLLDNWIIKGKVPTPDQQHFVMAIFIRGGVFGEKSE
jgi:CRISPR-associated protein Csy3